MAPNKKIAVANACHAMEQYGIPKVKTKAVMRELLKLYGTSWELIVQEGYKVLIDALFDKQEEEERGKYKKTIAYVGENSKGVKSKNKEIPHDEPEVELPSKRLRTRSQIKQALSQEEFSESNLAKIGSEQKDQNVADFDSDTELEDPAPLLRTKCSRNQDELALVPMDNSVSLVVGKDELSWTYCIAEATQPSVSDEQSHSEPEVHLSTNRYQIKQDFLREVYSKTCLPTTASKSEHHNVVHLHSDSDSELEDPEPLLRRKRSRHQNELALVSVDNPVLVELGKGELPQNCCIEEVAEATHPHVSDKKSPSTSDLHLAQQYLRKEGMTQCSPVEKTELSQIYPRSASPQWEEKNSKILEADCRDNTFNSDGGNDLTRFKTSRDEPCLDLTPATDVLNLYHDNSLDMLGDGFVGEVSQVEADDLKFLKTKSLDVEDGGDSLDGNGFHVTKDGLKILESAELLDKDKVGSDRDWSKFNIASSSSGEVKIAFLCNSSQQSAFHVTSDAVLQVAEKRFIEAYRIGEPSFSLKKLMIELCECFLAMGTDSTHDELSVSKNLWPFQKSGADDIVHRKDNFKGNHCILLCLPSEPFKFQNLVKVLPAIPKPMTSSGLEGLHCVDHSMVKDIENICHRNEKRLKLLIDLDSIQLCNVEAVQDYHIYVDDIARGEEGVKVTLENGRNVDNMPSFLYISRNMVYDKACVNFALDSISNEDCCICCSGDCLTSPIPCVCARKTGGGFAYTPGGLLKEKFLEECISVNQELKGHDYCGKKCQAESSASKGQLRRKFIKECWSKCECSKNCGNRVVQRGMTANLQVYWTPEGKGWGLRTLEHLPRGAFVCEYVGEIVTDVELQQRYIQNVGTEKPAYQVLLDAGYGSEGVRKDEESLCLDATYYGNVARFINHRCSDASLIEIPVEVETPDRSYYHVALFTTRKVNAMEELTWDYGFDFEHHDRSMRAFRCLCGSSSCRNPS